MLVKGLGVLFIFVLGYLAEIGRKYPNWTEGEYFVFLSGVLIDSFVVLALFIFIFKIWRSVQ